MKDIMLDILVNGRFFGQIKCTIPPIGKTEEGSYIYDSREIEAYVLNKMPTLRNKKYSINFSNQRIFS